MFMIASKEYRIVKYIKYTEFEITWVYTDAELFFHEQYLCKPGQSYSSGYPTYGYFWYTNRTLPNYLYLYICILKESANGKIKNKE